MLISTSPVLVLRVPEPQSDITQVHKECSGHSVIHIFKCMLCMCKNVYFEAFLLANVNFGGRWLNIALLTDLLPFLGSFPAPTSVSFVVQINLYFSSSLKVCVCANTHCKR